MKYHISLMISIMLLCIIFVASPTQTHAEEQKDSVTITVDVESNFTVTIPKSLELSVGKTGTGSAEYYAYAQGDIEGDKSIYIVPEESFTLTEQTSKEEITVSVMQSKTEWDSEDLLANSAIEGNGYLIVEGITPGDWSGTFYFNVEKAASSDVVAQWGLFSDSSYSNRTMSWDELVTSGKIIVDNKGVVSSSYENPLSGYLCLPTDGTVTAIADMAFAYQEELIGIKMPDTVTSVGNGAFGVCESLEEVVLSDSLKEIGEEAFVYCYDLEEIVFPDSLTSIKKNCFAMSGLNSVIIPENLTSIGATAFSDCESLSSIVVDSDNANYASMDGVLFNKEMTLLIVYPEAKLGQSYIVPDSVTEIEDGAFYASGIKNVILPDGLEKLGAFAFSESALETITIPSSVKDMGSAALADAKELREIKVADSTWLKVDNGMLIANNKIVLAYPIGNTATECIIPDYITQIGVAAFRYGKNLKTVTMGDKVTTIGNSAFGFCTNLTSVELSSGLKTIESTAFYECTSLTNVTIPDKVTTIGKWAFYKVPHITYSGSAEDELENNWGADAMHTN